FGDRKHGIVPQPARHGAGMPGLAEAFDRSMPHVAANPGDDADRKLTRNQHWTLLDMKLDPGRDAPRVEQRLALFDPRHVGANRPHAVTERTAVSILHIQVFRREFSEQRQRTHIGLDEMRALLTTHTEQLDRSARRDPVTL